MQLLSQVDFMGQKIQRFETINEQLPPPIAIPKRHNLAKRSEQLSLNHGSLLDIDSAIQRRSSFALIVNIYVRK
ncbi:hypothetical protein [Pseudomonas sp. FSL R10-0765]|uniref:hypothetical protein n=2 Tax=unclassified Pseudomonas TaxID=196821 RepID=UPI0035318E68